jgi:hypothetical protein
MMTAFAAQDPALRSLAMEYGVAVPKGEWKPSSNATVPPEWAPFAHWFAAEVGPRAQLYVSAGVVTLHLSIEPLCRLRLYRASV